MENEGGAGGWRLWWFCWAKACPDTKPGGFCEVYIRLSGPLECLGYLKGKRIFCNIWWVGSSLWSLSSDRRGWGDVLILISMGHYLVKKWPGMKSADTNWFFEVRNRTPDLEIKTFILLSLLPKMCVWIASIFDFKCMYPPVKVILNHHKRVIRLVSNLTGSMPAISRLFL